MSSEFGRRIQGQAVAEYGMILLIVSLCAVATIMTIAQAPIRTIDKVNSGFVPRQR